MENSYSQWTSYEILNHSRKRPNERIRHKIDFSEETIEWEQNYAPLKDMETSTEDMFYGSMAHDPKSVQESTERLT